MSHTHVLLESDCGIFDLVFIIDKSGSIEFLGEGNFNRTLRFLADVSSSFNVGLGELQVRVRGCGIGSY